MVGLAVHSRTVGVGSPPNERRITAMRWWRLAVALAWGSLLVANFYDYYGKWQFIPLSVVMVSGFVAVADSRRNRKTDELTTLNLTAR